MNDGNEHLHIGHRSDEVRIGERCWTVIDDDEPYVPLSDIDRALPDGMIVWRNAYLHAVGATAGRTTGRRSAHCPV